MKAVYRSDSTYYDSKKNLKKRIKKRVYKKDNCFEALYLYEKRDSVKKIRITIPFWSDEYIVHTKESGSKSTHSYKKDDLSPISDSLEFVIEYIDVDDSKNMK